MAGAFERGHGSDYRANRIEVRGVRLSHPARVVFPRQGYTKLDLARDHGVLSAGA